MARRRSIVKRIFSGSVLADRGFLRRFPVLLVIGLFMIIYIAIGFRVQSSYSYVELLEREIIELRTISVTVSAQRQEATRKVNILRLLNEFNIPLQEPEEMPKIIEGL